MRFTVWFISLVILIYCNLFYAQENHVLGSWNILHFDAKFSERWSGFAEAQLRSLGFYTNYHYYEYKGAAVYKIQENSSVALAFGQYRTYNEGGDFVRPMLSDELRLWPQFKLTQNIGDLKIEHRYRLELRFVNGNIRDRFRLRFGISYPLFRKWDHLGRFKIRLNNELFFSSRAPYFQRNRSQVQFAFTPNKRNEFLIGFLHQFDYQINDEIGRDFLVVGYAFKFDWSK